MDGEQPIAVLEQLLADKGEHLLRTAILLAGSQSDGEDLLQAALERVIQRWRTIRGEPEGYLRRTIHHLAVDGWRRKKAWRLRLGLLAAPAAIPDGADAVDQRDRIVRLLHSLPPRQRTAIVLRYWEELSEAEAAHAMGCSVGTVKSAVSRGLRRLRELSEPANGPQIDHADGIGGQAMTVQTAGRPA